MKSKLLHGDITEKIISSFFSVNKALINGLSTDIYRNALFIEFEHKELVVERDYSIALQYRYKSIGELTADFLVNGQVLVQVVCAEIFDKLIEEYAKLLLKKSQYEVCIVLNIYGDTEYKRFLLTNDFKR
ncbi:GxxExxY protein [Patescibacteria group bacterium]|nr:GxxExxY protein [Patescibacteria group bacterium]